VNRVGVLTWYRSCGATRLAAGAWCISARAATEVREASWAAGGRMRLLLPPPPPPRLLVTAPAAGKEAAAGPATAIEPPAADADPCRLPAVPPPPLPCPCSSSCCGAVKRRSPPPTRRSKARSARGRESCQRCGAAVSVSARMAACSLLSPPPPAPPAALLPPPAFFARTAAAAAARGDATAPAGPPPLAPKCAERLLYASSNVAEYCVADALRPAADADAAAPAWLPPCTSTREAGTNNTDCIRPASRPRRLLPRNAGTIINSGRHSESL
jgi:hypothetical protein